MKRTEIAWTLQSDERGALSFFNDESRFNFVSLLKLTPTRQDALDAMVDGINAACREAELHGAPVQETVPKEKPPQRAVAPTRLRDAILLWAINPALSREDIDAMAADADRRAAEIRALLVFVR